MPGPSFLQGVSVRGGGCLRVISDPSLVHLTAATAADVTHPTGMHSCKNLFSVFRAVEALVNYAYNGRVQLDINNVQSILVGANFLQLGVVKEACCEFLKNRCVQY